MSNSSPLPTAEAVDAIAKLVKTGLVPFQTVETPTEAPVLIWGDKTVTSLEHLLAQPSAKRGTATLADVPSLIDYINRHRDARTVVCGDYSESGGNFAAILDYHAPNGTPIPAAKQATEVSPHASRGWSQHRASVTLKPTPEWERWLKRCTEPMNQVEFGLFLEDNAEDVVVPADAAAHGVPADVKLPNSAELISVATTLSVQNDAKFSGAVRLDNGQTQLTYAENINGTYGGDKKLAVPNLFCIGVAPFMGGPKFVVQVRLRYRVAGAQAKFVIQLVRPHKVVETAWTDLRKQIEKETTLAVLRGSLAPDARKGV